MKKWNHSVIKIGGCLALVEFSAFPKWFPQLTLPLGRCEGFNCSSSSSPVLVALFLWFLPSLKYVWYLVSFWGGRGWVRKFSNCFHCNKTWHNITLTISLFLCTHVLICTCMYVFIYMEAGDLHQMPSSMALHLTFWDLISHWTRS